MAKARSGGHWRVAERNQGRAVHDDFYERHNSLLTDDVLGRCLGEPGVGAIAVVDR